jgi:phage/plasmid-like protein (TIGR03299 family)
LFGERFYGKREAAWHGLGKVFTHEPTAVEAFQEAGLNYRVDKAPVFVYVNGEFQRIDGEWGLVREPVADDPVHRLFGTVGDGYHVLNNMDIAPVVDLLSKQWPIETVGALRDGRTIFTSLKAGLDEVAGDELAKYFLLTDTKDGNGGAMKIAFTPVRVVCQNTLTAALSGNVNQFSLIHSGKIEQDLRGAVEIIAASQRQEKEVMSTFRRMAEIKLEEDALQRIVEYTYPLPAEGRWATHLATLQTLDISREMMKRALDQKAERDVIRDRILQRREAAKEVYGTFCEEHSGLAGTPWAMYNAIVELEDYRRGNNAPESLLFGVRARTKGRAYTATVRELERA